MHLTERQDQWALPLVGREVDQICVDFAVTLVVEGTDSVRLATPFTLTVAGEVHHVHPERPVSILPVLELHRAVVLAAEASKDGVLSLRFDGDRVLRSDPDEHDEAWEVGGGLPPVTPAYQVVAKPGGGVSVR